MDELISIIVPIYNVERYLEKCIMSIRKQTYQNIEIILVNDGSTDGSRKICESLARMDSRIKVINKNNGGLSSARNMGIANAQGVFVAFIDSDDWIVTSMIFRLYSAVRENNADMGACDFIKTFSDNVEIKDNKCIQPIIIEKKDLFDCAVSEKSYAGYVCNKLFKLEVLRTYSIEFDTDIKNGEDLPFVIEYLEHIRKVVYIKEGLYIYRQRMGSISYQKKFNPNIITLITTREKILCIAKKKNSLLLNDLEYSFLLLNIKVSYQIMQEKSEYLNEKAYIRQNIKIYKDKILKSNGISVKQKAKIYLMLKYPRIVGRYYLKYILKG